MVYRYNVDIFFWIPPTCAGGIVNIEPRFLRLTFGDDGDLESYKVSKSDPMPAAGGD